MKDQLDGFIANVAKATRQQLMDGYRRLLKKYQDQVAAEADTSLAERQTTLALLPYKNQTDVAQILSQTKLSLNAALDDAENKITEKFAETRALDEHIATQKEKLKELYSIEREAGALIALLEASNEARKQADNEQENFQQKRKREEEEYKFNFELQKRKDKETYEAEKRKLDAELAIKETTFAEKEKTLLAQQAEFEKLKNQVEQFPAELESQKQALAERLNAEAKKEKDTEVLILQKEMDAQRAVFEAKIKNLEAMAEEQKNIVRSLHEQLKAAQAQVQEVVIKSIEGASGNKTLEAVNKFALEQSRAGNTQK